LGSVSIRRFDVQAFQLERRAFMLDCSVQQLLLAVAPREPQAQIIARLRISEHLIELGA
jgi:hypothetical protein